MTRKPGERGVRLGTSWVNRLLSLNVVIFITAMLSLLSGQEGAKPEGGNVFRRLGQRVRQALDPMVVRGYINPTGLNGQRAYCLQNARTGEKQKIAVYGHPGQGAIGSPDFVITAVTTIDCGAAESKGLLVLVPARELAQGSPKADTQTGQSAGPSSNALTFDQVAITNLHVGMTDRAAQEQINTASPELRVATHWLSVQNNTGSLYNGALGAPLPEGANALTAPGGPFVKIGVSAQTPEGKYGCVAMLRPGFPESTPAMKNRTCERIWLQTTPENDGSTVVAISRILVFGENTKPALKTLGEDLIKKYGLPSATPKVVKMPSGDLYPVTFVWEFDANGRVKSSSNIAAVDDSTAGYDSVPIPYNPNGGYSGRTIVISSSGPEFTGSLTEASPRLLSATISADPQQPLLAGRLSVVVYDSGAAVRNRDARIKMHNKLVNAVNAAAEDKAREDAAKASERARPKL